MLRNRGSKVVSIGFWLVIILFLIPACARMFTRTVLVKRARLNNELVRFVFSREASLLNEAKKYSEGTEERQMDWAKEYPYLEDNGKVGYSLYEEETDKNLNSEGFFVEYCINMTQFKDSLSNYVEKYHPWQIYMKWLSTGFNRVTMGRDAAMAREGLYSTDGGWLYGSYDEQEPYSDKEICELADSVEDFYEFLKERNIGFIYASVQSKPNPYDISLDLPNKDRFLNAIKDRGIPEYDLSSMMPHGSNEWYELYFKTDPHWNDQGGLWASGVLAKYLNENCGFSFDLDMFKQDSFYVETRNDYFIGPEGRRGGPFLCNKENYTRFIPRFDTDYYVTCYSSASGVEYREGKLLDVFFDNELYDDIATWSEIDHYDESRGSFRFIENKDLYRIVNNAAPDNKDKKIIIIRDSYAGYLAPYLSVDVGEVDLIYSPTFNGSIRTYIEKTKPDAVIMLLVKDNIRPLSRIGGDFTYHFDLR